MGKKYRKGSLRRGGDDDDWDNDDGDDKDTNGGGADPAIAVVDMSSSSCPSSNVDYKSLDFAQRRELQRKQAHDKRRNKMKCFLCGQTGHVRRECPGIMDDGRGMSCFKAHYSNTKATVMKHDHKRRERKERSSSDSQGSKSFVHVIEYPQGFLRNSSGTVSKSSSDKSEDDSQTQQFPTKNGLESFFYHDTNCDIDVMLSYLKSGRGKYRISQSEALEELQHYWEYAMQQSNLGGTISRSWLRKQRPWISPVPPGSFLENIQGKFLFFTVGLSPSDFVKNTLDSEEQHQQQEQQQQAIVSLLETVTSHSSLIVGFHASLDYTEDGLKKKGCDKESQLVRLKWTCHAAGKCNLPVQVQVHPGITSVTVNNTSDKIDRQDATNTSVAATPYTNVLLDLQQVLFDCLQEYPTLKVHLSSWSGSASHMMAFLGAFPTLVIGLDSSVTFHKATHLHECAFELDFSNSGSCRVVLETDNSIPSSVANCMGRDAFSQPGWIPFIAMDVAKHNRLQVEQADENTVVDEMEKRSGAAVEIAKQTSLTAEALYPRLSTVRNPK
ncbi:zinc knuckle domain containing protein [Nitzschia inconspicua]|uniref:Zinc knuckle domain containing protein n=1 Tax=Nitzschia inconspicua TaxID=303405 RepID=A0A9K3LWY3_9STRA|nr:zinc knuckle domain containing protein [Nitzschia inconspicua]